MSIRSVQALLEVLRRVQLLTPEQIAEVARELGPYHPDPLALAEYLAEIDWLTHYQVRQLFLGEWNELVIGPYHLLDRLGQGGVSEVFKAWDTVRGRITALKVLRQDLADNMDAVRQLEREREVVTRLSHPNIIKTYDAAEAGGARYFAMEFVEGMDLDRFVQRVGPLPLEQASDYVRQVAHGLQHAHQLGLVHRDIKPANLFLLHPPLPVDPGPGETARKGPDPVVKIIDWGLARLLPAPGDADGASCRDTSERRGLLLGTADYIAPEQARDASVVDTRADIYSLGCTFYYLLSGRPPFAGQNLMQKLLDHQEAEPEDIRKLRPDISEEAANILRRMMVKKPEERYQIPLLVVAALRRLCPCGSPANPASRPGTALDRALSRGTLGAPTLRRAPGAPGPTTRPASSSFNITRNGDTECGPSGS
jgi:serine/threonine-protein kinase